MASDSLSESLIGFVDALVPIVTGLLWLLGVRLVNKFFPKNDKDDDEDQPASK
jgi:hypothetical protein